jgi:hypothetical protein
MGTCVGCGEPLAPSWKYCIHCGIAVGTPQTTNVVAASPRRQTRVAPTLIIGGVVIFLVGIALVVVALAVIRGSFS